MVWNSFKLKTTNGIWFLINGAVSAFTPQKIKRNKIHISYPLWSIYIMEGTLRQNFHRKLLVSLTIANILIKEWFFQIFSVFFFNAQLLIFIIIYLLHCYVTDSHFCFRSSTFVVSQTEHLCLTLKHVPLSSFSFWVLGRGIIAFYLHTWFSLQQQVGIFGSSSSFHHLGYPCIYLVIKQMFILNVPQIWFGMSIGYEYCLFGATCKLEITLGRAFYFQLLCQISAWQQKLKGSFLLPWCHYRNLNIWIGNHSCSQMGSLIEKMWQNISFLKNFLFLDEAWTGAVAIERDGRWSHICKCQTVPWNPSAPEISSKGREEE